jgi:hypothetical protein
MSKCKCDLRTKLVGDGCRYCNPQEYIDKLIESLEEQRTWEGLTDEEYLEAESVVWITINLDSDEKEANRDFYQAIEAKLKEKNT